MELYVKSGPNRGEIGDCPFAHYIRAVLHHKGLACAVIPCAPESKPEWLLKEMGGKMPCLKKGDDFKMVESTAIVEHLEQTHPEPSLTVDNMDEAFQVQSGFFPALAAFFKAPDFSTELEEAFLAQVSKLNDHLASQDSKYFAGNKLSLVDLSLAPKLYHMLTILENCYAETLDKVNKHEALNNYMANMFDEETFKAGQYDKSLIIWGWNKQSSS